MTDPNPLIAERVDSTTWSDGLWLVESIADARAGIASGSWVDASLGTGGAALDGLGFMLDPVGSLVSMGVGWLIEHVRPLSQALDWLAGDPDQIAAFAQTWANVATRAAESGQALADAVTRETAQWVDRAGEAYRAFMSEQVTALGGIAEAAAGIGEAVAGSGELVAAVRMIVRDLIADCVSALAVRLPMWLAQTAGSFGIATPYVVSQVGSLVARWAARITRFLTALLNSLAKLGPLLARLVRLLDQLRQILARLARQDPTVPRLSDDAPTGGGPPGRGPDGGPDQPPPRDRGPEDGTPPRTGQPDSEQAPFGRNTPGDADFHGSGFSLDEITQFVHGHTGGGNPAMGRPASAEVEAVLRNADGVPLPGQNAMRFEHRGVRVIVNFDIPWRSTAYYL